MNNALSTQNRNYLTIARRRNRFHYLSTVPPTVCLVAKLPGTDLDRSQPTLGDLQWEHFSRFRTA